MAALLTLPQFSPHHKSPFAKFGVLTIYGFGLRVRMQSGHLEIEDGIGSERRKFRLPRVGHGLKRLVCVAEDGFVTLSALKWLADQRASFVMLDRFGKVLVATGPVALSDVRLRRGQAVAHHTGAALPIARELITHKLQGQEQVARNILLDDATANEINRACSKLTTADSIEAVRLIESLAASAYWSAWRNLSVHFPKRDTPRIPAHWQSFGTRASPLTGSPRLASNPINAILNFLYAILESESRLAAAALGLDPGLGVLHVDTPARDSLACDLMEPARPQVDAYVLNWITKETLSREWFTEMPNGNCRLTGKFAEMLSRTALTWGRAVAPYAEKVAHAFWASTEKYKAKKEFLPTRLTQQRRIEGRGNAFVPKNTLPTHPKNVCSGCGARTVKGQNCSKCGHEISKEKLIELAKVGRVVAQRPESQKKRSAAQLRHFASRRSWLSSRQSDWPDENTYKNEIQPRLAGITISAIAVRLGVSEPYAADIRTGRRKPHPCRWQALAELVNISKCSM